jgi:hypothetical protein
MAAPEFELEPPDPILYLCDYCLDAGPEHLDTPHKCQKAWSYSGSIGQQKCECPCGEIYANKNRLVIYCRALRCHARLARRSMKAARRHERAETKSRRSYQGMYNQLSLRQEAWLKSERTIADLNSNIKVLRESLQASLDRTRRVEIDRDVAMSDLVNQIRQARDYKVKADAYDKLMTPMETTKGRHIILDEDS